MSENKTKKYYNQAVQFVTELRETLTLTSAVLDKWGGAIRIVYGSPLVRECQSVCESCDLFNTLGTDKPGISHDTFVTTLCLARQYQLDMFPSKQKYLNCKTFAQYLEAFIAALLVLCQTKENIEAELDLVKGFRILYMEGVEDLALKEKESKQYIVAEALAKMEPSDPRKKQLSEYASRIGIMK